MNDNKQLNALNDEELENVNAGRMSSGAIAGTVTGAIVGATLLATAIGVPVAKHVKKKKTANAAVPKETTKATQPASTTAVTQVSDTMENTTNTSGEIEPYKYSDKKPNFFNVDPKYIERKLKRWNN